MKALSWKETEIEITTTGEPKYYFKGKIVNDLNRLCNELPAEECNALEKAKDELYDMPIFDGNKIQSQYANWLIEQKAEYATAYEKYAAQFNNFDRLIPEKINKGYITHLLTDSDGCIYGGASLTKDFSVNPTNTIYYWSEVYVEHSDAHSFMSIIRTGKNLSNATPEELAHYHAQSKCNYLSGHIFKGDEE